MTAYLLVTGSRLHTPAGTGNIIKAGLAEARKHLGDDTVLIHGGQGVRDRTTGAVVSGADLMCAVLWEFWGLPTDPHPADWSGPCDPAWPGCKPGHRRTRNGGQFCPLAGFRRNQKMVDIAAAWRDRGARVLVEGFPFPGGRSGGTRDCLRRARVAGLSVWVRDDPKVVA